MEYRLASSSPFPTANPFPAALIDCLAGYQHLVTTTSFEPSNIIIAGDSAGGTIAYQLARHISGIESSTKVAGLLLLSPAVDMSTHRVPGSSFYTNARSDYLRAWAAGGYGIQSLLGSLPRSELDKSWFSPGSSVYQDDEVTGLFEHFPRTMMVAGEAEMGRDAMRVLARRMKNDMGEVNVEYLEVQNAPHDFVGIRLIEPERTVALEAIGKWVGTLWS